MRKTSSPKKMLWLELFHFVKLREWLPGKQSEKAHPCLSKRDDYSFLIYSAKSRGYGVSEIHVPRAHMSRHMALSLKNSLECLRIKYWRCNTGVKTTFHLQTHCVYEPWLSLMHGIKREQGMSYALEHANELIKKLSKRLILLIVILKRVENAYPWGFVFRINNWQWH